MLFTKRCIKQALTALMALVVGGLFIWEPARAENQPLMTYSVDLVSDYVARGEDLYVRRFAKYREAHAAVNFAPAPTPVVVPIRLSLPCRVRVSFCPAPSFHHSAEIA
jgi:hypothetical protein